MRILDKLSASESQQRVNKFGRFFQTFQFGPWRTCSRTSPPTNRFEIQLRRFYACLRFNVSASYLKFDFIYWTGDLPPHNVWNQSKSDQINALDTITGLFQKYFGDKVIYPTLGNHEATPVNL